jgi:hypothetical protein
MNPAAQNWLQVAALFIGIAAALVGTLVYQTHYIDKRLEDLRLYLDAKFEAMDARFKAIDDRLERLEHPVTRP